MMFPFLLLCLLSAVSVLSVDIEKSDLFSKWNGGVLDTVVNTTVLQPECKKAYLRLIDSISRNDLDGLKMLDATAKLPSGILSGNINQYGDFDECMAVPTAQYCLAELELEPLWKEPYLQYKKLAHSYFFFRDTFEDPAHRIPGFSLVRWGFCIPRECSDKDLTNFLHANLGIESQIRPGMCQKSVKEVFLTTADCTVRIFFGILLLAVFLSSYVDYFLPEKTETLMGKILMSFSLRRNGRKLLEVKYDVDEIAGVHGMKSLSALCLFMCHKGISIFFNPLMNRTYTVERLSKPWTILAKNAIIYTDTFLLVSGLLNANALFKDLNNKGTMNFKHKFVNRIFRILPNLVAVTLFCTYILPSMGAGPLWPTIIDHHSVLCKKYMWRNFLFVHNYFGFENMCLTHTHQLGIDMQLFLVTPLFVYLLNKHKRLGIYFLFFSAAASTVLRFWVAYNNEFTGIIYFGVQISKLFEAANLFYILPTHRATIYIIGIYLMHLLKSSDRTAISQNKLMWCIFLLMALWTSSGSYHMTDKDFVYEPLEGAIITSVYPILWGSSMAFGIYAIYKNSAGILGRILTWPYFQVFTKLSYAFYLIQFPVFFYNVGATKHVAEFKPHFLFEILETSVVLIFSAILVLCIEMPFQNIHKLLFNTRKMENHVNNGNGITFVPRKEFKSG